MTNRATRQTSRPSDVLHDEAVSEGSKLKSTLPFKMWSKIALKRYAPDSTSFHLGAQLITPQILRIITTILELVNRKTISALDVVYALKRLGTPLYGFGMIEYGELLPDRRAEYQAKLKRNAENRARVARDMEEDQRRDEHEERLRRVDEGVRGMMRGARA